MPDPASPAWPHIETLFLERRAAPPDVVAACAEALAAAAPDAPATLRTALASLAAVAARPGPFPEPAYHGRHHFAEAILAMGWLCAQARAADHLDASDAACGVIAMAGHDLLHDGSVQPAGTLEARAAAAVDLLLAAAGVDAEPRARIAAIIRATDPACAQANHAAHHADPHDPDALLAVLANEADLAASLMPRLGPVLGTLLAAEWHAAGAPGAATVATPAGRLAFLRAVPALTAHATALGLAAAHQASLDAAATAQG